MNGVHFRRDALFLIAGPCVLEDDALNLRVGEHLARLADGRGAPYNMGKAALEALAFTLAQEERAHGIHVNVVAPGLVETDMGVRLARSFTGDSGLTDLRPLDAAAPFGRVCQPADVADVVHYLCTNAAGYLTGQRIECDGGGESRNY